MRETPDRLLCHWRSTVSGPNRRREAAGIHFLLSLRHSLSAISCVFARASYHSEWRTTNAGGRSDSTLDLGPYLENQHGLSPMPDDRVAASSSSNKTTVATCTSRSAAHLSAAPQARGAAACSTKTTMRASIVRLDNNFIQRLVDLP